MDSQQNRVPPQLPPTQQVLRGDRELLQQRHHHLSVSGQKRIAALPLPLQQQQQQAAQAFRPQQQQQQQAQPSLPQQQQRDEGRRQNSVQESMRLVAWLRDTQLPLEGSVASKTETAVSLRLMLPGAAHQLLPTQVRIPRRLFTQGAPRIRGPLMDADTAPGDVMKPPDLSTALARQRQELWRRMKPGDTIRVQVLGIQQQQRQQCQQQYQQQYQQQEAMATQNNRPAGRIPNALPSFPPTSLLELIVQPVLEDSSESARIPPKLATAAAAAATQTPADQQGDGEAELLERLSQQRVSRWLRFLSPPTATWVVPAALRGDEPLEETTWRPTPAPRLRAPPSTRPLSCQIVGLLSKRKAAVVEVVGADDEWHPAVSGIGVAEAHSSADSSVSAKDPAFHEQKGEALENSTPSKNRAAVGKEEDTGIQSRLEQSARMTSSSFAPALPYKQAERSMRLEQQTSKDALHQQELLAQQDALLHKMLPQKQEADLRALHRLCQQHPQLHSYQNSMYSYSDVPQEEAIGALGLLPLEELAAFMRLRKGWKVQEPLRLYFSSVEVSNLPRRGISGRRSQNGGFSKSNENELRAGPEGATLWFSIYPAVPLEVAHLLLHDMPVPHLAPHLRMFEQRQIAQQHEEHQQLLRQIHRYHESLSRERALRREQQQRKAADDETTPMQTSKAAAVNREKQLRKTSDASTQGETGDGAPGHKPGPFPLHRIPVKPLWWATGDWVHREARLSQLLGPFFYRQLMRLRVQEEQAESASNQQNEVLDPRGEPFEDIIGWLTTPELLRQLTPRFVRKYINALCTTLKLLPPRFYPIAFQRFLTESDMSDKEAALRISVADVPNEVRSLLQEFLSPRRTIIDGLIKYRAAIDEKRAQESLDNFRVPRQCWEGDLSSARSVSWPPADSSVSSLMQLLQLHSRLRLQLRPQQRAPSLEQWRQQQQHRDMQRRGQRRSQSSLHSPAENAFMGAPDDMPRPQLHLGDQDEYDRADKIADEVEQQLLEYVQEAPGHVVAGGGHVPYTRAYPSAAIRKPRTFYNYMDVDLVPLLESGHDETLVRFAGGPGAFTAHELFIPLPLQQQQSTTSPLPPPDPSAR